MPTPRAETIDFTERAKMVARASHELTATPDEIFAVLADTPSWPRWFATVSAATWTSDAPYGVGSTRRVKAGPMVVDERFIAWEPGVRWGFTFAKTNLPFAKAGVEVVDIDDLGDGRCRVTYTMAVDPVVPAGPIRRGIERGLGAGLRGLEREVTARRAT